MHEINDPGIFNTAKGLTFDCLTKSLADAVGFAAVSFDLNLTRIDSAGPVTTLLNLSDRIDQTLSEATDPHGWKNWTEILRSVLQMGQTVHFQAVKATTGSRTHLLDIVIAAIRRPDDQTILGGGLIITDVTQKSLQDSESAQSERLATMGKVAGRVAHELNNPLDGILRYINLSLRALESNPEKARQYLQHCRNGILRMVKITSEMLEFSRGRQMPFEKASLDKLIEDALSAMEASLDGIEIRREFTLTGPALSVKSEAMFQVFCNLIKNAADAMAGTGTLTVRLTRTRDGWETAFSDTGGGFDPAYADDLFKPFFTTKPPGQGTGLGLAICKDLVEKLGGSITAANIPDGCTLTVRLPDI